MQRRAAPRAMQRFGCLLAHARSRSSRAALRLRLSEANASNATDRSDSRSPRPPCLARGRRHTHTRTLTPTPRALRSLQVRFFLLQNRQGKTRLSKWYVAIEESDKRKIESEVHRLITSRDSKFTNFVEYRTCVSSVASRVLQQPPTPPRRDRMLLSPHCRAAMAQVRIRPPRHALTLDTAAPTPPRPFHSAPQIPRHLPALRGALLLALRRHERQ